MKIIKIKPIIPTKLITKIAIVAIILISILLFIPLVVSATGDARSKLKEKYETKGAIEYQMSELHIEAENIRKYKIQPLKDKYLSLQKDKEIVIQDINEIEARLGGLEVE